MSSLADTGDVLEDAIAELPVDTDLAAPVTNPTELINSDGQVIKLAPDREKVVTKPIAEDASKRVVKRRIVLKEAVPAKRRIIRLVMKKHK